MVLVPGSSLRVQDSGFRFQGSVFMVQGEGGRRAASVQRFRGPGVGFGF